MATIDSVLHSPIARRAIFWVVLAFALFSSLSTRAAQRWPKDLASPESAQDENIDTEEQRGLGWLILRGEIVHGPYQVEIVNHEVTVNGHSVDTPAESTTSPASPEYASRERLFRQFQITWEDSVNRDGLSAAQRTAVLFWQLSPLVASAYMCPNGSSELLVLFRGEQTPEHVMLNPPDSATAQPDEVGDENLRAWANTLEYYLTHGRLVILQGEGHLFVAPAGEGGTLLQELREALTTISDGEEKFKAVRKLVPDDDMAKDIAERFR